GSGRSVSTYLNHSSFLVWSTWEIRVLNPTHRVANPVRGVAKAVHSLTKPVHSLTKPVHSFDEARASGSEANAAGCEANAPGSERVSAGGAEVLFRRSAGAAPPPFTPSPDRLFEHTRPPFTPSPPASCTSRPEHRRNKTAATGPAPPISISPLDSVLLQLVLQ